MSASSARKWIELNWLRKFDRSIPLPEIMLEDLPMGAGYVHKQRGEILVGERYCDLTNRGLIVLSLRYSNDDGYMVNAIAHEWRHHVQWEKGKRNIREVSFDAFGEDFVSDYKRSIIKYYTIQWWEMDALLFSLKFASDETSQLWFDWLRKGLK
jgi:hypothetical protein